MVQLKKKITSFKKIVKLQSIQLNQEQKRLEEIRVNLEKVDRELKNIQDKYWENIDAINQQKLAGNKFHIEAGQASSNFYREQFMEVLAFRKKVEAEYDRQQLIVQEIYKKKTLTTEMLEKKEINLKRLIEEKDMEEMQERAMLQHQRYRN